MSSQCYQPNSPNVLHEVIDGEAVLINLESGNYYSIDRTGAEIWGLIQLCASKDQLVDILAGKYDAGRAEIETAVSGLLAELLAQSLVVAVECQPGAEGLPETAGDGRKLPFEAPVLHTYTDMSELLLLDPIHDVDETGWPMPATDEDD